jgi:hypothetical protein
MAKNDTLLKEIREQHEKFRRYWRPIFDEGDTDMRYISGDPWDPEERARRLHKRPCLGFDQLGQYVNQLVNEVRANPRSIKVLPAGSGANDKMAEARAEIIRGIEYRSNAQLAYTWGFQNAVQRSYGFWRIIAKYVNDSSFDQELLIKRILNPNNVLLDPYATERNFSDMQRCFVLDFMSKERFEREFPNREVQSFDWMEAAPGWLQEDGVQVAEYWKVEEKKYTIYQLNDGQVTHHIPLGATPINKRVCTIKTIRQYLTNGIEILETKEWPGQYIPIVPCFGRELWMQDTGSTKRMFLSLIRLARDPQMLYAYMRTQEAEEAKLTPRAPYTAVEGQLEGHTDEWQDSMNDPKVVLYYKTKTDATGDQVLPPPTRTQFQPNFQSYSVAAEDSRRDIQAAMGTTALPTSAQRQNEKSGIALQRIEAQMSKGSYDFIDAFEVALQHTGQIINPLLGVYYDQPRDLAAQKADKTYFAMRVNDQEYVNPKTNEPEFIDLSKGEFDVTISTGPSFDSQREEANQFVDLMVSNIKNLPIPPILFPKLLALAIRLKNLGPIGDQMADILDPQEDQQAKIPPQALQAIQQLQQQLKAIDAFAKEQQALVAQLQQEKQAKVIDNAAKSDIAKMQAQIDLALEQMRIKGEAMLETLKAELDGVNAQRTADMSQQEQPSEKQELELE